MLPTLYSYGHNLARSNVQCLHRTVRDYLETPEIWRSIESAVPTEGDDYWALSLCLGYIMLWKNISKGDLITQGRRVPTLLSTSPAVSLGLPPGGLPELTTPLAPAQPDLDRSENARTFLENCVDLATNFLPNSLRTYMRLLDAIGSAIFDDGITEAECNRPEVLRCVIWRHDALLCAFKGFVFEDFLSVAVHLNLFDYVDTKISVLQPELQVTTASRLLVVAALKRQKWLKQSNMTLPKNSMTPSVHGGKGKLENTNKDFVTVKENGKVLPEREQNSVSFHMMQVLMRHGADPDFKAYGMSAREILDHRRTELTDSLDFQKVMSSFDSVKYHKGMLTKTGRSVFHRRNRSGTPAP